MVSVDASPWSDLLRRTLSRYDEALLRRVAAKLLKPRNQWPAEELIARAVTTATNPAVLDRRLKELEPAGRRLLALIGHSRQPRWALGNLVELLVALGHEDGLGPVMALLQAGLLYPYLGDDPAAARPVKSFEQWLASPGAAGLTVFTLPLVASRALGEDLGLPEMGNGEWGMGNKRPREMAGGKASSISHSPFPIPHSSHEADGLEWLLRLAVFWQQVVAAPLRKTTQGGFFKRDVDRLAQDPLLNGPPSDKLADVPDLGFLIASLAELQGMVREADGELRAAELPAVWDAGLAPALEALWADLPRLRTWTPLDGWRGGDEIAGNPFPSAYLLAFLLLGRAPADAWLRAADVEAWLYDHHPYWAGESLRPSRRRPWLEAFLLGFAFHLRVIQAARDGDGWRVRLSPTGRWLLGLADTPPAEAVYSRTLLVQPNLEIVAYRQGLSAALIGRLSRVAAWKTLGPACTLQLGPEVVYRALERGETFETITRTLDRHGTRPTPPAVLDLLRTWADKRDRITVYPSATLLEFATAADLNEALARGVPAVRLSDTLAVVTDEEAMEFRHFRLTGTRDYVLPPERCVTVEPDGVTLAVDPARADLFLETELPRFAVVQDGSPPQRGVDKRHYRLTPASLAAGRESGMTLPVLEAWFQQRAGRSLPAPVRLLLTGSQLPPPVLRRHLVLHVADEETADGLVQWPETAALIEARLGPTALVVAEDNLPRLRDRLRAAGISLSEA